MKLLKKVWPRITNTKKASADEDRFDKWFGQIREVLNNQDTDSVDFLQDFKMSFLAEEIYVYTPKGDVKMLPIGSTALDFAFSIHSAVGTKCIGAKINHKLVPISHKLTQRRPGRNYNQQQAKA